MTRVAIYTDAQGVGFKALAPGWVVPQEFGWTRSEAVNALLARLIEEARSLRQHNRPLPSSLSELPVGTRGELEFFSI